jgi:amino-acid N-acetyltransferase
VGKTIAVTIDTNIRTAMPADFDASRSLLVASGLPVADLTVEHLGGFILAEYAAKIVGLVGLERFGAIGLLRSLVVDSSCRGSGLGHALVDALELQARKQQIAELWLLTIDADRFFASLGYVTCDRQIAPEHIANTPEFAGLCPSDAVLMRKQLYGHDVQS